MLHRRRWNVDNKMFQKNWNPWPIIIGMAVAMTAIAVFYRQIL